MILRNAADEAALGTPLHAFATAVGVNRKTLWNWRDRLSRGRELTDRSPVPHAPAQALSEETRQKILAAYEASHRTYGGRTLEAATGVPHATCDRVIALHRERHEAVAKEPPARVEILAPLVVLAADSARVEDWTGTGWRFMTFEDEHSRLALRLLFQRSIRGWTVRRALKDVFDHVGVPLLFKTDRGREFKSRAVQNLLAAHGVLWFAGPPYYPEFNGKNERSHDEFLRFVRGDPAWPCVVGSALRTLFVKALVHLNREKPRLVLDGKTSAEVFHTKCQPAIDRKSFNEEVYEYGRKLKEVYPQLKGGVHPYRRWAITCALVARGLAKIEGQKVSTFIEPILGKKL